MHTHHRAPCKRKNGCHCSEDSVGRGEETIPEKSTRFGRQCVPPISAPPPLLTVSMKGFLQDACKKLDMPAPIYRGIMSTDPEGGRRFRDIASLVLPGSSRAVVVLGRIAQDPNQSWEEAARARLRVVLRKSDSYVDDYNHQIVLRWKEKYAQLCQDFSTLEAEHRLLTDALQSQIPESALPGNSSSDSGKRLEN
ncbi:hypothetical protein PIB30_000364 [Stylosanthes scabra]|uniref:Uncharacterized protein n=1 Tax=Stylosanthes scabra TaxID=79078 RepID=A0ABU6U177_9FABA|nr:hypothetical protein [Stylosanthes scabra]